MAGTPESPTIPLRVVMGPGQPSGPSPLVLPPGLKLSPVQFALVCEPTSEAVLKLAADGQLITITPTGGETGRRNTHLLVRLQAWANRRGAGRCSTAPAASASSMAPCSAPMHRLSAKVHLECLCYPHHHPMPVPTLTLAE